jgi:predicted RND superfamily exporter protein
MSRLLREVVDPTYTKTNLTLRMKSSQYIHQRPVIEALQAYLDQHFGSGLLTAQLAGRANLDYHWVQIVSDGHVRSICFTSVPVFIVTALMFRSVVAGLLCALPVAMTIVVNYAIMGFGGIPLGVGTSMFASIAIGSGVNFPIHVLDRLQAEFSRGGADPTAIFRDTFAYTGRALFFAAIVVGVGFSLLCVSEFRTLVHFGLLIGMAMVVAFLTSITLLPAVLAVMKPRFIWCASRSCGASLTKVTATSQPDTAD